jgi:hypothetical protein
MTKHDDTPSPAPAGLTGEPTRDDLGQRVRELWVAWARTQPAPKPSWLVPYDELSEPDKEADRQIGEGIWREAMASRAVGAGRRADGRGGGEAGADRAEGRRRLARDTPLRGRSGESLPPFARLRPRRRHRRAR